MVCVCGVRAAAVRVPLDGSVRKSLVPRGVRAVAAIVLSRRVESDVPCELRPDRTAESIYPIRRNRTGLSIESARTESLKRNVSTPLYPSWLALAARYQTSRVTAHSGHSSTSSTTKIEFVRSRFAIDSVYTALDSAHAHRLQTHNVYATP